MGRSIQIDLETSSKRCLWWDVISRTVQEKVFIVFYVSSAKTRNVITVKIMSNEDH